jgi:hypothetical protein
MGDDFDGIECVAMMLADQIGRVAARLVRDHAEIADVLPDMPSAETWRDIRNAIERLRPTP